MKVIRNLISALFLAATTFAVGTVNAQAPNVEEGVEIAPSNVFDELAKAQVLANEGINEKSAPKLIEVAKMYVAKPWANLDAKKEEAVNAEAAQKTAKVVVSPLVDLDVQYLLAEARNFTQDAALLSAIEELALQAPVAARDALNGPYRLNERVNANCSDFYTITFNGKSPAEVFVDGAGSTNLDLYVYDESGSLIRSNELPGDKCRVVWKPKWTGKFRVQVKNRGGQPNEYVLSVN